MKSLNALFALVLLQFALLFRLVSRVAVPMLVIGAIILIASPVAAQEETINPDNIPTMGRVLEYILGLFALFGAGLGVLAEPLTQIYKFVVVNWWKGGEKYVPFVALILPPILGVIYWISDHFGFAGSYIEIGNAIIKFTPQLLLFITSIAGILGQSVIYQVMRAANVPGLGKTKEQLRLPSKRYGEKVYKESPVMFDMQAGHDPRVTQPRN